MNGTITHSYYLVQLYNGINPILFVEFIYAIISFFLYLMSNLAKNPISKPSVLDLVELVYFYFSKLHFFNS